MKKRIVLRVGAGSITGLHNDKVDFRSVGEVSMKRASDVHFDNERQGWAVTPLHEDAKALDLPEAYHSRTEAIDAEVTGLNDILKKQSITL